MELVIDVSATDVTNSAVTSVTDDTPVAELKQLFTGDDEPLSVQFTDGSAAPAWASDATYVLTAALGVPTPTGLLDLTSTSSFTLTGSTRTGSLDLSAVKLTDYLRTHLGDLPGRRSGLLLSLQLRIETPAGKNITYAQLPVTVQSAVAA
jgi:hypothetical protein